MSVNTAKSSKTFQGNGGNGPFPCDFRIFQSSDVTVSVVDQIAGTQTVLVPVTDYLIVGANDDGGFTVTTTAGVPVGKNLLVKRLLPYTQPTSFTNQGRFFPVLHQDMGDRLEMQIQQLADNQGRALTYPDGIFPQPSSALPFPQAGSLVGWSADGTAIVNIGPTGVGAGQLTDVNISAGAGIQSTKLSFLQTGTGAQLRTAQDKMRDQFTVRDFGAVPDGSTDASTAIQRIKTAGGGAAVVRFVGDRSTASSTYKVNTLADSDLDGLTLDVPSGVTVSLPSSAYRKLTNMNVSRQTRFYWADILCDYYPSPKITTQRDKTNFIGAGDLRTQKLTPVVASGLRFLTVPSNVSDAFSSDTPTFTDARSYSYTNKASAAWYGGFISLRRGETYRGTFSVSGTGQVGIMFRHANGYSILACDATSPANNLMSRYIKQVGSAIVVSTDTTFPGRGIYNSYNPQSSTWSVRITDSGRAIIAINGRGVTAPVWITSLGDIFEVAFVWGPSNGASSCSVADVIIEQNSDPLGAVELGEIRIFGDSTSDYLLGAWQDTFKDMLDHTFGVKLTTITNFAVSGTNSFDVNQAIATNGLGNAYYVVVGVGTNDIQGGSSLASSEANLSSIISQIQGYGRVPVMVLPYMWYTQAQAVAGRGQASLNYDKGAPLRARLARLCAETGAIMVDPTFELPEPKPSYVTTDTFNDPLVRDNLHQSALGNKLYAWAIARAIASAHAQTVSKDYSCLIPADWMRNGWTRGGAASVFITNAGRVSIQGNFAAGTTTVGTVIMNLPRWARPAVAVTFPCSCNGLGNVVLVAVATNGDVSLTTSPSSMTVPDLNTISFNAV